MVVYSGDDEVNEFVYKFVSKDKFNAKNLKANADILDNGTLFVAKFEGKQDAFRGDLNWVELTFGKNGLTQKNGFKSQADILINTRIAATFVGATPMDRCEWIAAQPNKKLSIQPLPTIR